MIRFEHVSKRYPAGNFSLENVQFEIEKGDFVFLIGTSGAGKTTVLKLILREIVPDEGSVIIDSAIISKAGYKDIEPLRRKIGSIFQDFKIMYDKNVLENILVSLAILNDKKPKDTALEALQKVGLGKKAFFFPIQLSAGELQRLAIARAIAGGRRIILADEPTGNLDPVTTWEIVKLFRQIHTPETTIVFATHNADIVNTLKKRVITLKAGKLIKDNALGTYSLDQ